MINYKMIKSKNSYFVMVYSFIIFLFHILYYKCSTKNFNIFNAFLKLLISCSKVNLQNIYPSLSIKDIIEIYHFGNRKTRN